MARIKKAVGHPRISEGDTLIIELVNEGMRSRKILKELHAAGINISRSTVQNRVWELIGKRSIDTEGMENENE